MKTKVCSMVPRFCLTLLAGLACWPLPAGAQLFENLGLLSDRIVVGNPHYFQTGSSTLGYLDEYPKGLATADLNGDQHADWVVSRLDGKLVFAYGRGDGTFDPVQVMETPASSFRQLIAVDLNGDGRVDLAGCDPFQGILYLFTNNGTRQWDVPATMPVWEGARNLASGDFNGDGITDLITAGPDRDQNYDWSAGKPIDPPPAVPQPLHGVAYLKGSGGGVFATPAYLKEFGTVGQPSIDEDDSFPRPVYVLKAWRPAGESRDRLLAGHALSSQLSILTDNGTGTLTSLQTVQALGKGIRAVALGSIYHAAGSGVYDLVVANRDLGLVEVFRGNRGLGFENTPAAAYPVPTGPRALDLADLNGDGWMDLTVVERYGNKLSTWRNTGGGLLEKSGETPTGWSPRELVMADFDEDGRSDFAVLNRTSADVSLHLANPLPDQGLPRTGFKALDQVYPTGGDVAQLAIQDLNNDGRGDILQLHRLSEEISIRMSGPGGKLGPAVFYKMGARPESMSLTDANNDGNQDLVTTNLGDAAGGLYTVRIGDGTGAFGPLVIYRPPPPPLLPTPPSPNPSLPGGVSTPLSANTLFSVISTDLDGDGIDDLVAGYYDCRGVALKGRGDGTYVTPPASAVFSLVYESRYMVHGDFDKDGDEDLAVSGYTGQLLVLENTGNFFLTDPTKPQFIRHPYAGLGGGREIVARDFDGDGDLDLVSASGTGVQVLLGRPGIAFFMTTFPRPVEPEQPPIPAGPPILTAPGLTFAVQTMAWGLFDGDNSWDLATVCKDDGCLRISANTFRNGGGGFKEVLVVDCPLTVNLQAGDVDGDGRTDLAGTGAVLWVALSSRPAQPTLPLLDDAGDRRPSADLVINEIIPGNDTTPINLPDQIEGSDAPAFFSKRPDCVELYNGSAAAIPLAGWKLEYFNASGLKQTFTLPADTIPAKGYRVILCYDKKPVSPWRSGFPIAK